MAKAITTFNCNKCGTVHKKWAGRCDGCGEWNTIVEEAPLSTGPSKKSLGGMRGKKIPLADFIINNTNWENTLLEIAAIHKHLMKM